MTAGRQIIFDTETTGLNPLGGDRITEIGCVEIVDLIPTGRDLRILVNPERDIDERAAEITGLTWEKLKDEPVFAEIADRFLDFVGDSPLVAHNADFDRGFINMELERCGRPAIEARRFIDTAAMARRKFPGSPASLDALCKRFGVSLENRTWHGALIDAYLLAEVYLELNGGREQSLALGREESGGGPVIYPARTARRGPAPSRASEAERAAHAAFIEEMENPVWRRMDKPGGR